MVHDPGAVELGVSGVRELLLRDRHGFARVPPSAVLPVQLHVPAAWGGKRVSSCSRRHDRRRREVNGTSGRRRPTRALLPFPLRRHRRCSRPAAATSSRSRSARNPRTTLHQRRRAARRLLELRRHLPPGLRCGLRRQCNRPDRGKRRRADGLFSADVTLVGVAVGRPGHGAAAPDADGPAVGGRRSRRRSRPGATKVTADRTVGQRPAVDRRNAEPLPGGLSLDERSGRAAAQRRPAVRLSHGRGARRRRRLRQRQDGSCSRASTAHRSGRPRGPRV